MVNRCVYLKCDATRECVSRKFVLQVGADNTQSASPNSAAEIISKTVSSLDLSGAEYGTLLLKDKLHEQAYAFAVVTFKNNNLAL